MIIESSRVLLGRVAKVFVDAGLLQYDGYFMAPEGYGKRSNLEEISLFTENPKPISVIWRAVFRVLRPLGVRRRRILFGVLFIKDTSIGLRVYGEDNLVRAREVARRASHETGGEVSLHLETTKTLEELFEIELSSG